MALKLKYALTALIACLVTYAAYRFDRRMTHNCTWLCCEECH